MIRGRGHGSDAGPRKSGHCRHAAVGAVGGVGPPADRAGRPRLLTPRQAAERVVGVCRHVSQTAGRLAEAANLSHRSLVFPRCCLIASPVEREVVLHQGLRHEGIGVFHDPHAVAAHGILIAAGDGDGPRAGHVGHKSQARAGAAVGVVIDKPVRLTAPGPSHQQHRIEGRRITGHHHHVADGQCERVAVVSLRPAIGVPVDRGIACRQAARRGWRATEGRGLQQLAGRHPAADNAAACVVVKLPLRRCRGRRCVGLRDPEQLAGGIEIPVHRMEDGHRGRLLPPLLHVSVRRVEEIRRHPAVPIDLPDPVAGEVVGKRRRFAQRIGFTHEPAEPVVGVCRHVSGGVGHRERVANRVVLRRRRASLRIGHPGPPVKNVVHGSCSKPQRIGHAGEVSPGIVGIPGYRAGR